MQQHTIHIAGGVARNPLVRLLNPVTLDFLDGEHIAIAGPNGAKIREKKMIWQKHHQFIPIKLQVY